ncbi:MAG: hypothetical protein LBI27_00010 [Clostridiales bacterium]|nr:hypothetical protein [Clostridiales bacterium]
MDKDTILKLLTILNTMLNANDEKLDVIMVGGANMCAVQMGRVSTHDIDTYCTQKETLYVYRDKIKNMMEISEDWLNAGADLYMTPQIIEESLVFKSFSNLTVRTPTDEAMLALKVTAARDEKLFHDVDDAAFLLKKLGINDVESIKKIVDRYKPKWWDKFGYAESFCKKALSKAWDEHSEVISNPPQKKTLSFEERMEKAKRQVAEQKKDKSAPGKNKDHNDR